MKGIKIVGLVVILLCAVISCKKGKTDSDHIEVSGVIQEQGITTYQYGTHTIAGYALRSTAVNLDDYVDMEVTVSGHKIEGYPISGGPDYIEVESVK